MKAIEQYFNYLKDAGADVPSTVDSFKKTLSDKNSAEQYYGYLKQNNFDAPDSFDSFAKTLGINKTQTVPVKKKDGSDPLSLDTPSVSGLNPEDPIPSVSALLKQRKKLKAEKDAPKPTSAPGFPLATVETAPVIDYDSQISKIDEQIKAKGYDPDELDVKFGEYDIDVDDNKFKDLYTNYNKKPFATTRQFNATTWHQAIERVQSKNPDEQLKQKNLGELKKLISDGYKLPSYDLNTAINFGRNAYQQILTLTADGDGKDREIAIENFKKDYSPVLAQIALRDKKFSSQQNLPLQMGLLYEDIFDKSKADQTRAYLSQDLSGNPDAVSGRDRIRYGTEENGLSMIQAGAGEEIEDKYDNIKKWLDWQKNNIGKLSDLGQKIAVANPEIKATIDAANIEIQKINKSVESSPLVLELNKQKDIADQYENDYKAGIIGRDIYVAEVDRYNELYEQYKKEVSQAKYKAEQIANVANEKAASSGVSPEELKEYNRLKGEFEILENERGLAERANIWSNYFTKEKNKIVKNNPTVVADKIIMQMQEWDGENSNPLERFFLSLGSVVPKAADAFEIIYDSLVSSPEKKQENDLERAGRSGTDNLIAFYNTNKSNVIQSPMITVVPESIEKRRREIDANPKLNEAEREEAKKRILRDGFLSGEIYQTTNPNAGKINITAKSILNSAVTVVPQILTAAGLSYITGGAASGVAVSTFLNGYSSYYNDAVSQGIANPNQYAFSHSLIDFGFEMFGTKDLKLIQSAVKGYKGVGAKFFKDLTDAEFKSLLAGSKNAFKDTRKALISNLAINAGETGEEIGAQVAGNVIDQELFGIKKPATEGVTETFLTTSLGQMPLTLLGIPLSVNKTNIANKYALYNASTDVNGTMAFLKKELDAGNLTSQEYTDRVKLVNDYAKAIKETPATYADGNPMRDDDKAKYAFNQFISNMKADKSPLPPQQKQSIDQVIADAENENDKILSNATNQSQVQEGRTEGDLGQPQGIVQGQPEVGQGAGSQGQAEVTTANVGDSNISGQGQVVAPELSNIESFTIDRPSIVSNTSTEVDRLKAAELGPGDGVTLNMDGTKYEGGGLVVPIASINTTQEELTPELIANFAEENNGKLSSGQTFKFGLYKFPDSNQVSIDLNIVTDPKNRDIALEFGRKSGQESLFDLSDFSNVQTGADGQNPVSFSDDQIREIGKAFEEGRMPNVFGENTADELSKELGRPIDKALAEAIPMVEKSLQEAGIKIQVVDAATDTEEARAARGNQGLFRSEDGTIIIDKSKLADEIEAGIVVWHEASHPVMNIIRNTDKPLYDAVVRGLKQAAKKNTGVAGALNWAQSQEQYDNEDTQNDEAVVETIGRINAGLIDINSLDTGLRQKLIDFINSIAKYFGIDPILNDRDIAAFKKTVSEVADALKTGRDISEIVGKANVKNYGVPIGVPTQAKVAEKYGPKVKHSGGTYKLSFVKPSDIIDIRSLIKDIADKGQKVWFWTADQLGRGMYYDNVIEGEHYLDAGPSFALDPENRSNNVIWATGKGENWVNDKIANSDYIFIISGSPQKSKLFNKRVAEITFNRVKKAVGEEGAWDKFKSEVLGVSKIGKINEILNKYNSFEELIASPDRKELLIQFDAQKEKKGTPLKALLEKYGAFIDYNDLRDGFFKDNDFKLNDIMLVLKPTGYGGKSKHSTYENDILGEVVGVPDRKVNAYDIMPDDFKAKYAPDMSRTEQSQAVAPYGAGVRNVQASVGNRKNIGSVEINKTDRDYNGLTVSLINGTVYHRTNASVSDILENGFVVPNQGRAKYGYGVYFNLEPKQTSFGGNQIAADLSGLNLIDLTSIDELDQVYEFNKAVSGDGGGINYNEVTNNIKQAGIDGVISRSEVVVFDSNKLNNIREASSQASVGGRDLTGKVANKLTDDGQGNYVFFHYSGKKLNKIDPSKFGSNLATGRDERPGVGISMYYVDNKTLETGVPSDFGYAVRIPKDKVYPFNEDPLNFYDQAKAEFEKDYPGQAFDANKQIGYITKVANDNGFDITVADWNIKGRKALRAQTTKSLKPEVYKQKIFKNGSEREQYNEELQKLKPGVQASVGNRSEEDLRAEGNGKERPRALASKYGNLNPATQAKIEDDATVYFERTNKQTKEAVDKFLDGLNIMDAADYVLSNPKIPEVSQVWMAAEVAKRLNAEIDAAGNNQDLIDDLTRKQGDVFNEFAKKATSLGQAVQAFIAFKDNPNAVEFFLPKILRQLKKAGVENVTEEQRAEILTLLKNVNTAAEGLPKDKAIIKLSHYLAGIAPLKPMDVLQSIWYAKILSGITTQSTNFFANIFNTVFELPVVALRISMLNGTPLGMLAGAKGFASGVAKGAVTAADIIKSGVRSKEVDKYFAENPLEYFTWSKWLGNKGKVLDYIPPLNFGAWKYVGRLLAATDAFFATANQEAIANMLAYAEAAGTPAGNNFKKANALLGNNKMSVLRARAQAKAEGFEPGTIQYKRRELEIIAQKRTGTQEADEIGKRITMNYDPEGFTKPLYNAVVGLIEDLPIAKVAIPFARIVANLTENGLNYSPFGFAKAVTGIKDPFQGLKSERMNFDQRTDMFYKSMLGMGMLLYILPHVGEDDDDWFEITAGGSTDLQKKYELQKGGWRPYTITLKDGTKISYKDWPTAGLLAGLGHVRDATKYKIDDTTQTTLFATGFFLNLYDKSLLKGLQDLFGLIPSLNRGSYSPDDKAMDRLTKYAAQQVKSVALSNLSQQSLKLYSELVTGDPQRDAKTFAQIIYRDIPILNDGIRPIIDVFGDEVPYTTSERLLPVMDSPEKEEIIEWLNKNKLFVGVPMRKNIKLLDGTERPMTDDEYYEYRKNAGKSVKKFINEFMSEIKNQDIGKEAFEKVVDAARQEAYGEILMKANNL